jgi:glycosyltransferase involved in cell wall biosynthesis
MTQVLFLLNSATGGATLSAIAVMDGLRQRGHRCYAIVPSGPAEALRAIRAVTVDLVEMRVPWWHRKYRTKLIKRPPIWALDMLKSGFHLRSVGRIVGLIRRWRIDIVHTNTSVTLDGALAAYMTGTPHVWHIRELIGRDELFRFWLPERQLAGLFVRLSRAIIANSYDTKRLFDRTGYGQSVDVVYNGINVEEFATAGAGELLRQAWGIQPGETVVGMVANLTARMKRHDIFLRAAAEALRLQPTARFVIVGQDPDRQGGYASEFEYARQLKTLASELDLAGRIIWAGHVQDIPAVMHAIDILVHPSDQESFGRVAIEAMASSRPVIAAASGGLAEIVLPGQTGFLVANNDPSGYAAAMLRLIQDPKLCRQLGEAGAARARDVFSSDQMVQRIAEVYQRVLAT